MTLMRFINGQPAGVASACLWPPAIGPSASARPAQDMHDRVTISYNHFICCSEVSIGPPAAPDLSAPAGTVLHEDIACDARLVDFACRVAATIAY